MRDEFTHVWKSEPIADWINYKRHRKRWLCDYRFVFVRRSKACVNMIKMLRALRCQPYTPNKYNKIYSSWRYWCTCWDFSANGKWHAHKLVALREENLIRPPLRCLSPKAICMSLFGGQSQWPFKSAADYSGGFDLIPNRSAPSSRAQAKRHTRLTRFLGHANSAPGVNIYARWIEFHLRGEIAFIKPKPFLFARLLGWKL